MKRLLFVGLLALVFISAMSALAASNTVPVTGLGYHSEPIVLDPNKLKPDECASLNLTVLYVGGDKTKGNNKYLFLGTSGDDNIEGSPKDDCIVGGDANDKTLDGTSGDDIILGGSGDDTIDGGQGNDTLYGGPGDDTINGGSGNDIIYGGDENNTIDGGSGTDLCYGGTGTNSFSNCSNQP